MTYSDSKITYSDPKVTYNDPKVTYSDPKVTLHTSPYLHLHHQTHITPLVKSNETSGWWWWWVVVVATNFSVSSRQGFKL